MSSDESDTDVPKRKVQRINDTPASTSSTSPVIRVFSRAGVRSYHRNRIPSSNSESGSPIISRSLTRRRRRLPSNSDGSTSSASPPIGRPVRSRTLPINSDSDTDVTDSPPIRRRNTSRRAIIFSDNENEDPSDGAFQGSSQCDTDSSDNMGQQQCSRSKATDIDSDSSDGNSDKCPICLVSFKKQKIGTPESCEHMFCLDCILEWSKNVNTCPIDRKEYRSIFARERLNGNVIEQIPIEISKPEEAYVTEVDNTSCQICGSTNNEERMLLCDGCDLGFHMFCLSPPLHSVPSGYWYCRVCQEHRPRNLQRDRWEHMQTILDEVDYFYSLIRQNGNHRLIPRTRHSERVRQRVVNNRQQQNASSLSPSNVDNVSSSTTATTTQRSKRRRSNRSSRRRNHTTSRYRTEYVIDEITGETVGIQKKVKSTKRRKRRGRSRNRNSTASRPATSGCSFQHSANAVATAAAASANNSIDRMRQMAGIPTLHLFGQNNQLDYFSGEDESYDMGTLLLTRRAPNRSDVAVIRRASRRKAVMMPNSVSSSTNLLDSILNSQEQFHSRNASYSLDENGKFKIENKNFNADKKLVDVTKQQAPVKQAPYNPNRNNYYNNRYNNYSGNNYNRRQNNYYSSNSSNQNYYNSTPSSSMQYSNSYHRGGNRFDDNDRPQDYTQRTLCASNDINPHDRREREEESGGNSQNSESEVDIYGDIETVTTSRPEETDLKPPPTPPDFPSELMGDDDDSEPDMVIDEKNHENVEDTSVTSTVGYMSFPFPPPNFPPPLSLPPIPPSLDFLDEPPLQFAVEPHSHLSSNEEPHLRFSTAASSVSRPSYSTADSSIEIQSQAVQSSAVGQRKLIPYDVDEDDDDDNTGDGCPNSNIYSKQNVNVSNDIDDDSNDGCPNFSIYSKESKNVALHTDISLPSIGSLTVRQIREISSSPNVADIPPPPIDDEQDMYNPEVETELSQDHLDGTPQEILSDNNNKDCGEPPSPEYEEDDIEATENQVETAAEERTDAESPCGGDKIQEEHEEFNDEEVENVDNVNALNNEENVAEEQNKTWECLIEAKLDQMEERDYENKLDENMETRQTEPSTNVTSNNDKEKEDDNVCTEDEKDEGSTKNNDHETIREEIEPRENKTRSPDLKNNKTLLKGGVTGGLYSDSEDENVVKKNDKSEISFGISDINDMTEDISEEERSYTPCLDEKKQRQGLEGLDTEMISDDDRNDFDESHELKTIDDGDALEINAKESELDFTRPEDYEEGEIVDKNKTKVVEEEKDAQDADTGQKIEGGKTKKDLDKSEKKTKRKVREKIRDKIDDTANEVNNKESFKKLSRNNKERNYRDKDKEKGGSPIRSKEKEKSAKEKEKERKKEKRKELERYNVRALIAEKPRPLVVKDQFGRDIRQTPSRSRSRSYTPPPKSATPRITESVTRHRSTSKTRKSISRAHRSPSRGHRSPSRTQRSPSRTRRSLSRRRSVSKERGRKRRRSENNRSRSRSRNKKRPSSKNKKRKRSAREMYKRKSGERGERRKKKRTSSRTRRRSRSGDRRAREWEVTEWSPPSLIPVDEIHVASPSWTPPRMIDNAQALRGEHLTVTLNNSSKRKRDRRKGDRRNKENMENRRRRRRIVERDRTPPPSKEVFASGDNILVSVSFNNESEVRDVTMKDRRKAEEVKKRKERRKKNRQDLTGVKPVAIIDLARSPFREITSPKAVIVLTDESENDLEHNNDNSGEQTIRVPSSQEVASPERNMNYSTGPKTPPEPQVKFTLISKAPQVRAITNPLHEPDDVETNDIHEELESRLNDNNIHNGPSTPPEPPNSPPSSPDAYDPFEPTKSRSPTPEPSDNLQSLSGSIKDNNAESRIDSLSGTDLEKSMNPLAEINKPMTPPLLDIQPADSQSSIQATPENDHVNSPERSGVNHQSTQPSSTSKPVAQTTPFSSSVPTSIITSTPISSNMAPSRINILNSTIISAPASAIPQRIVLPNLVKSSPVKISPTKAAIKSTPIKPMPTKATKAAGKKRALNNSSSIEEIVLDFDSPYSPGSSDYEDLFEPPSEIVTKPVIKNKMKSPSKHHSSTFDNLFNSPSYKPSVKIKEKSKSGKKNANLSRTKTVGVKLDEDNLKILDDLPNSAVEMLVKDKFLKKLHRLERVVEEVKHVLKPHYTKKKISKEEYKDIMRKSVPKICHNKSGEINPSKIQKLVEAYVRKLKHNKKVTSSSSVNPQKV